MRHIFPPRPTYLPFPAFIIARLKSRVRDEQIQAAEELTQYVENEGRDLSLDTLGLIFEDLCSKLLEMINGGDIREKVGGICAMDKLIGMNTGRKNDSQIADFASTLRNLFERSVSSVYITGVFFLLLP
jgi:hypothetical protein